MPHCACPSTMCASPAPINMRFAGVALFVLALPSLAVKANIDTSTCSNGLVGVENAGICCSEACGECGGSGCRTRPGGNSDCCTGYIATNGDLCSVSGAAPCIIDDDDVEETFCRNGLTGVGDGDICCDEGCGVCGGSGCKTLPGGRDNCCMGAIEDSGVLCSESGSAPCIIDDVPVPMTFCNNDVPGVNSTTGDICCAAECGTCGGPGCRNLPGGKENCCTGAIADSGVMCGDSGEAPCIINEAICSNGLAGVQTNSVCCLEECGICGGSGCSSRDGGQEGCCITLITDYCNATLAAPCIIS